MSEHDRCEAEIRRLGDAVRNLTARALEAEQRHVADLAAARGVTTRLREALLSGATDEVQAMALADAAQGLLGSYLTNGQWVAICAAFLALHEERKALRAELARLREQARVIGMGPAL